MEWPESHASVAEGLDEMMEMTDTLVGIGEGMAEGLDEMMEMTGTLAGIGEGMAEGLAGKGLAPSAA